MRKACQNNMASANARSIAYLQCHALLTVPASTYLFMHMLNVAVCELCMNCALLTLNELQPTGPPKRNGGCTSLAELLQ